MYAVVDTGRNVRNRTAESRDWESWIIERVFIVLGTAFLHDGLFCILSQDGSRFVAWETTSGALSRRVSTYIVFTSL